MQDLVDHQGRRLKLGAELGKGGEGGVYELAVDRSSVVKVYHQRPLPDDQVGKLEAIVSLANDSLRAISAWPSGLVFPAGSRTPCGLLMPKIANARHLHELYGTLNRRKHFPGVGWHHMVLAARNTAAAFHTVQQTGVVIGDVNQGNLMVDADMCVRLIDCDSFQVFVGNTRHACPVGTPHFTPPELQSLQLREVERTTNHDSFGMAVLIFHLLFMGRHPFAGRYLGPGEMTIEKAIAERRFAFSAHKSETLVEPPPASLLLEDLPRSTAELFERAFRSDDSGGQVRPTAMEWVKDLDELIKQRKDCKYDSMHVYYASLGECPWCRIEDSGGPAFFVESGDTTAVSQQRLEDLNRRVLDLRLAEFPDLAPAQLDPPNEPRLKPTAEKPPLSIPDVLCCAFPAAVGVAVFSVISPLAILGSVLLSAAGAISLLVDKEAKARRQRLAELRGWLEREMPQIHRAAAKITSQHQKNAEEFRGSREDIEQQVKDYRAEGKALVRVLVQHMDVKRDDLLRNNLIRDSVRSIRGVNEADVPVLESYGIESAYDIEQINLSSIPMISSAAVLNLMEWRREIERGLVLKPDHGVTPEEMAIATDAATRRYKVAQARRVLTSASRLESAARSARRELDRQLRGYQELGKRWRGVAQELAAYQSNRRVMERKINASPTTIVTLAVVIPLVGAVAWLLAG